MLDACKAPRRTMNEIAQGPLIPTDCAHLVAVVQPATRKKRNLTVVSFGTAAISLSPSPFFPFYLSCASILRLADCPHRWRIKCRGRFPIFFSFSRLSVLATDRATIPPLLLVSGMLWTESYTFVGNSNSSCDLESRWNKGSRAGIGCVQLDEEGLVLWNLLGA